MKTRSLFLCGALLCLVSLNGAFAADEGTYQRTIDGKTLVWNNHPMPAGTEAVEWSGDRDKDGYATGQGTVTWYERDRSKYTFVIRSKLIVEVRYTGNMAKGKLEGTVVREDAVPKVRWQADPQRIFHAKFVGGNRTSNWFEGRE